MSRRVLVAVLPGDEAIVLDNLITVTRAAPQAQIRVACFRPLPAARMDRHDRVVVDADGEMDRIRRDTVAMFEAAARGLDHAALETVVRFGPPAREVAIEADVFGPDLAVLFAPPDRAAVRRVRAWRLRRTLARRSGLRVLVVDMPRPAHPRPLRAPAAATS